MKTTWANRIYWAIVDALYGRKCGQCCAVDGVTGDAAKSPEDTTATQPKTKSQVIAEFAKREQDCMCDYRRKLEDLREDFCQNLGNLYLARANELARAIDDA